MIVYLILIAGFAGGAWYYWKYQRLRPPLSGSFIRKPTISEHIVVGFFWGLIGVLVACIPAMILSMLGAFG